jgi:hypothetical protein
MVGHNSKYTYNLYKSFANKVEICLSMLLHYKIGKKTTLYSLIHSHIWMLMWSHSCWVQFNVHRRVFRCSLVKSLVSLFLQYMLTRDHPYLLATWHPLAQQHARWMMYGQKKNTFSLYSCPTTNHGYVLTTCMHLPTS